MSPKMKSIFSKKYITGLILFTTLIMICCGLCIGNGGAGNGKFSIVSKDMKPYTEVTDKVVTYLSNLF